MHLGSVGMKLARAEKIAREVSAEFRASEIHHALVGGLAVAAHGYPRATADVDMIVVESDRVQGAPLGIPGVTFKRRGVSVDVMFIGKDEKFLRAAVLRVSADPLPVLPLAPLVYLKLKAGRCKDYADVVEMLKVSADAAEVGAWLHRNAPKLLPSFRWAEEVATRESEGK